MKALPQTPLLGRASVSLLGRKNDKVYLHYAFYKLCILIFSRLLRICHTPLLRAWITGGNRDVIPTRDAPAGTHATDRGWKPRQQAGQSRNGLARAWRDLGAGGFNHLELTHKRGAEGLDRGAGVEGEIRIADRGYSAAKALRRFVASVKQAKGRRLCCPVASPRMEANYRVKNEGLLSTLACAAF